MNTFTEPKIVIVVFGDSNVGKTTLLQTFISQLKPKCEVGTMAEEPPKRKKTTSDFRFSGKYQGVKIGISTRGDTAKEIFENFQFFQERQCRIVVTAVHKTEDTSTAALDLIVAYYSMIGLRKIEKVKMDKKTFDPATSPLNAPEFKAPLAELFERLDDALSLLKQLDDSNHSSVKKQVIVVNQ